MRVMVTGGAGYIGSVVTEELLRGGDQAVVYDSLYKGHREAVVEGATFVKGDLLDTHFLRETLAQHKIEAVVHMAADSLVGESVKVPAKYYRNNVLGGLSLLDAMRESDVKYLVFSSTAAVYGEPAKQPIEESDPTQPTNPYGETKLAFERALRWYDAAHGLKYVSLRYFNAAGATERSGERHDPETHLIPIVLQAAAGQRPDVTVFGDDYPTPDGTCVRDYIHVVDLAQAHILALHALAKGHPSSIYNLGCGGEGYSVKQVIDCARRVTGKEIPVTKGPRRAGDPAVLIASSGRITRELGWKPTQQKLDAIVESAWRWMQRHR
ncbi:UDP-glucose 4-epimerase GalE [Archangium gephyra]|uniref:UDP-glucose 4-epimerase GalE n=1 Tax=Archangium gephyra TaxID=48 RepID=UPI003B80C659